MSINTQKGGVMPSPHLNRSRLRLLPVSLFAAVSVAALAVLVAAGAGGYATAAANGAGPPQYGGTEYRPGNPPPGDIALAVDYTLPEGTWQPESLALEPGMAAATQGSSAAWIGNGSGNLVRLDLRTGDETIYNPRDNWLPDIQAVAFSHGTVWFVTVYGQLGALDARTGEAQLWDAALSGVQRLSVDAAGHPWMPGPSGVATFDPKTGVLTTYQTSTMWWPRSVERRSDGTVWWCDGYGVGRLDPRTGASTLYNVQVGWGDFSCGLGGSGSPALAPVWIMNEWGPIGRLDPASGIVSTYYGPVGDLAAVTSCGSSAVFTERWTGRVGVLDPSAAVPDVLDTWPVSDTTQTVTQTELSSTPMQFDRVPTVAPKSGRHVAPAVDGAFRLFDAGSPGWWWSAGAVADAPSSTVVFLDSGGGVGVLELPPTSGC